MLKYKDSYVTPILSADRIKLRGWQDSDFKPYLEMVSDPELMKFVGNGAMDKREAHSEFDNMRRQWVDRKIGVFVISDNKSNELLGFTGLFESPCLDEPELCWSLSAKKHGKGYASEAAILARNWAFNERRIGPLMSLVHPDNINSKRLAERLGAVVECNSTWMGNPRLVYRHKIPD